MIPRETCQQFQQKIHFIAITNRLRSSALLALALVCSAFAGSVPGGEPASHVVPKTQAIEVKEMVQGIEIVDPYRWLEDQESPQTRAWIAEQNAYTDSLLNALPGRDKLKEQLAALLKPDVTNAPNVRNGRYFFFRRKAGEDLSILYLRKGLQGKDEVLLDPHSMSADHTVSLAMNDVSLDGSLLVYSTRQGGEDELVPHILDVDKRTELSDDFPRARYGRICLLPDKSAMYFSRVTKEGPRVYLHKLGQDTAKDEEIFGKGYGPDKQIACQITDDGQYLLLTVVYGSSSIRSEVYVQDLAKKGPITPLVNDIAASFQPMWGGHKIYMRTNWKAPKWRIVEADLETPAPEHWREVVAESDAVLESFNLVGGKIAAHYTQNVVSRVKIFAPEGKLLREVTPPALGNLSGLSGRWISSETFYGFSSFNEPPATYRYDVATGKQSVWSQRKLPIDPKKFEVKQVWYSSKDGTKIPMFLAHAKGLKLDGTNPTLLTGYGGFNLSSTPNFSALAAAWMANGGVYALANLRGGGEFGEAWHHAGMLDKKQNVFDDFIAAAEWLIASKYTNPNRLAIYGGSNGGLLVGAAITQRPELFAAAICRYPLLDMVRYQKFLVGKYWVDEYGSSDNPEQLKYILSYSPYQHVKTGTKYPAVFFVTGDSDTRVAPLHARKMTALMQASTGSDKPIMIRYETKTGHSSGGLPVSLQIDNMAEELGFLMWQTSK